MGSPTQRSLELLRKQGYTVGVVEHWNPFARIRQDLFGFIDLVAVRPGVRGVLAVQTTSGGNVSARLAKIRSEARAGIWLAAGNAIVVHGWRKNSKRRWECREVVVDFVNGHSTNDIKTNG